nr:hypothetical transcript [Hymenolepis microstoma]
MYSFGAFKEFEEMMANCLIFALILYTANGCVTRKRTFDMEIAVFETINSSEKEIGTYKAIVDPLPTGESWYIENTKCCSKEWERFGTNSTQEQICLYYLSNIRLHKKLDFQC